MAARVENAPSVLGLLGHDIRWQLVRKLAESDRRVSELVDQVDAPQNLVSYHLKVLKDGRLVAERRSSADGRDTYYHLDVESLGDRLGAAAMLVHPAIAAVAVQPGPRGRLALKPRVLFICTGNSARSQMAEAVLRHQLGSGVEVHSGGPKPTAIHPLALEVLRAMHISTSGLHSKDIEEMEGRDFDFVITLCDNAREVCPPDRPEARYVHWSLPDPAAVKGALSRRRRAFRETASEITRRMRFLLPVLTQRLEG